jgi:allantoicase
VADFCGENIKPGWMVTREKKPGENWVKYSLNVQGASGKLKTVLIGDYLTHLDLVELE